MLMVVMARRAYEPHHLFFIVMRLPYLLPCLQNTYSLMPLSSPLSYEILGLPSITVMVYSDPFDSKMQGIVDSVVRRNLANNTH